MLILSDTKKNEIKSYLYFIYFDRNIDIYLFIDIGSRLRW